MIFRSTMTFGNIYVSARENNITRRDSSLGFSPQTIKPMRPETVLRFRFFIYATIFFEYRQRTDGGKKDPTTTTTIIITATMINKYTRQKRRLKGRGGKNPNDERTHLVHIDTRVLGEFSANRIKMGRVSAPVRRVAGYRIIEKIPKTCKARAKLSAISPGATLCAAAVRLWNIYDTNDDGRG